MSAWAPFPEVTHVIDRARIDRYAELSGDFNPLHVDPVAAAASEFGGIIAHGPIALQSFLRAATEWLGVEALPAGSSVKVTYRAPTRPGDHVAAEVREVSERADGRHDVVAECVTQDGTTVVSVRAVL